jgi:hypothetical protein
VQSKALEAIEADESKYRLCVAITGRVPSASGWDGQASLDGSHLLQQNASSLVRMLLHSEHRTLLIKI